jgi:hypothetical protein
VTTAAEAPAWRRPGSEEYEELCRARLEHLVPLREPLVLISQVQRSGGTLLSQLFDGHPECHAHPSEIYVGHPRKWDWPPIDLAAPETWFETLYERPVELHLRDGYVKEKEARLAPGQEVYPFLFLPALQKRIFDRCVAETHVERERDVLDCYFTSYFNAWLDNQNLYTGPKRIVTGFTPRLAAPPENIERFFDAYPDGSLVTIVRDPCGWYYSASRYRSYYEDLDEAIGLWRRSAEASLAAAERHGDRVVVLTYEQLVRETERTMRHLADRLGISMSPVLLVPTFNGRPVRANSSELGQEHGVVAERADAYCATLDPAAVVRIEELAGDLYERAASA